MTICESMKAAVNKRLDEGKNITDIGKELCRGVKYPERKVIRIIKDLLGQEYLDKNSERLKYNKPHNPKGKNKPEVKKFTSNNKDIEKAFKNEDVEYLLEAFKCPCGCGWMFDIESKSWSDPKAE